MISYCTSAQNSLKPATANMQASSHKPVVLSVQEAEKSGRLDSLHKQQKLLDSLYESAVHVDLSKSVFKTDTEKQVMGEAYERFLQEFGDYLHKNKFHWQRPTRFWHRFYFARDGSVDYYIYNSAEFSLTKAVRYKELFTSFAATHKIAVTAPTGFAQCGHVTFKEK
jgi:hypothetical protein